MLFNKKKIWVRKSEESYVTLFNAYKS
jgi:hypothetical protein